MADKHVLGVKAIYEKVSEGYIGYVEEIHGVNIQGKTLEEARENLKEALKLILETNREITRKHVGKAKVIREEITVEI